MGGERRRRRVEFIDLAQLLVGLPFRSPKKEEKIDGQKRMS